jgi:hypothetical protein
MRIIILFFVLLPTLCFSQFTDNFSDFEFLSTPTWFGDIDSFNATTGELNSAGPNASAVISLATNNTMIDNTEWHFKLSLGFNPSTTNFVKVYLVSSASNIEASLNGYYIKFGETGNDSICIYRQDGLSSTLVFKGTHTIMPASSTSNSVGVKVIRDAIGNWDVSADNTGGTAYVNEGSFLDNTYSTTSYFGVICDYGTASRATLYHFDNFYVGNIIFDVDPPIIEKVVLSNLNTVSLLFNEYIDTTGALSNMHYSLSPSSISNPTSVSVDSVNKRMIHLFFGSALMAGTNYTLNTNGVNDLASNTMLSDVHSFYVPNKNDIVINEIYADPDSTVSSLPNAEFIELYNRSAYTISLQNWQLFDASTIGDVGAFFQNLSLAPDAYVTICDWDDTLRFLPYGRTFGVDRFPSLNNTDDELLLQDNFGRAINYVHYDEKWYKDDNKKNGGYSLERMDPSKYCIAEENWMASQDTIGGSPAAINSVAKAIADSTLPALFRAAFVDSFTIDLIFSEPLDELVALNILNYQIDNGLSISTIQYTSYTSDRVRVSFLSAMSSGIIYTVTLSNITDCSGNLIGLMNVAKFGIPQKIDKNDLVINEILFNPVSGGYDFVELYNRTNKILDLKNLKLLEANPADSLVYTDNVIITAESFLVLPDEYVVLSENIQNISDQYFVPHLSNLLQVNGMPNYDDNDGIIELYQTLLTIDKLSYSHNWHFALLDIEDGVSLERIDYNQATQQESNWHSAAKTVGFATPTYQNSEFIGNSNQDNVITIDPLVFTPDEDGNNDVAGINFKFDQPGYMLSIRIYDANGRLTKSLVNNELVAIEGRYTWDGTNDNREKARIGVYIAYTEIFDLSGKVKHYKSKIILASKF